MLERFHPSAPKARPWIFGLLVLVTLLAYAPAIRGGFIWDDDAHVTKPELRSLAGLGRIWFDLGATQQYYPVLHSAFWLEHHLWGDAAVGYHLINVLLHATAAFLLVLVLRRLWKSEPENLTVSATRTPVVDGAPRAEMAPPLRGEASRRDDSDGCPLGRAESQTVRFSWNDRAALFAGLIFALHPVGVESVAWISEQKNTLSAVFYLLAALTYLKFAGPLGEGTVAPPSRSPRLYWLATLFFILALLSKSVTATLPAALLVVIWWRRGRLDWRRDVVPLVPWLAIGVAGGLFTAYVERTFLGAEGAPFALSPLEKGLLAGRVIAFYLGKLVWPANLIFIYPHWQVSAAHLGQFLFPLGTLILLGALWALRRRTRAPLAAFLFFAGTLFPALGFFNVYPFLFSYVADHFQYLASIGVIALAAGAWGQWRGGRWPQIAAAALLLALASLTWAQSRTYRSAEILYRTTLARNPGSWLIGYNLGVVLDREHRDAEAIGLYRDALRLKPDLALAHNNLGNLLVRAHRVPEGVDEYHQAIADYERSRREGNAAAASWYRAYEADAEYNLGVVLWDAGHRAEALDCYREALRLKPSDALAYRALGRGLSQMGGKEDALAYLEHQVRAGTATAADHNDLGVALQAAGRSAEAKTQFEDALRLEPGLAEAQLNLGNLMQLEGNYAAAIADFQAALWLKPDDATPEHPLAVTLFKAGRPADAVAHYQKAAQFNPTNPQIPYELGIALRTLERYPEAIASYREALRLNPNYPDAENDLGIALAQSGRVSESVAHFETALRLKPDYADVYGNLLKVLGALGRNAEAAALEAKARRLGVEIPR